MTGAYLALLQERMTAAFNRAELADLCLRLGVNFDSLPDAGLEAQARELILLLARQGRLPELLAALRDERPAVDWPPVPPDFRPPAAAPAPAAGGFTIGSVNAEHLIIGHDAKMNVTHGPRYELSGDFREALLNIESTLHDVRQTVEALPAADDAARAGLIRLVGRLDRALRATPPGRAAEAAEVADIARDLIEAAGAARPRKAVVRGQGDALREAAAALADAMPDVPVIAGSIAAAAVALVDGA